MVADHERMHGLVKEIISSAGKTERGGLEKQYGDLLEYSERILEKLSTMEQPAP
jgi:hypothetical protein